MGFRRIWNNKSTIGATRFDQEIERHGRYYILMRANKRFRCPNYRYAEGSCSLACPICLGEGYVFQYESHKMYKSLNMDARYNAPDFIFYEFFIKQTVDVKREDHIIEIELDNNHNVSAVISEYEVRDTILKFWDEDRVYSMASTIQVRLTTTAKRLRYLQSITEKGIIGGL